MQVYGLVGQLRFWPHTFLSLTNQSVNLHIARKSMFYLLYYTESLNKSLYPFVAVIFAIICF